MLQRTYIPSSPLSMFVDYIWYLEGYNPSVSWERTLPDGSVDVIIQLRDEPIRLIDQRNCQVNISHSILCGPQSGYYVINTAGKSRVIGIHFKPGGIHPFLQEPLNELLNTHVSLAEIWGLNAGELREEIMASKTVDAMFRIIERKLLSLKCKPLEYHSAILYALKNIQRYDVTEMVDQIGLSHRRFNQVFKEAVGLTPKRFSRIQRFQEALRLMVLGEKMVWTDIALDCGYYDQAHFIKDFQSFAGINPSEYHKIPGRHQNHVSL